MNLPEKLKQSSRRYNKSNSLRSFFFFLIESSAYSFIEKQNFLDQLACVQALNCSTWTFTPAWSERSLKVENGTGPEFSLFARPTSGTQLCTHAEADQ